MTSEGLGEVFTGDSADTCGEKFPLVSMGGRANGHAWADGERGPPSARAELTKVFTKTPTFLHQHIYITHMVKVFFFFYFSL